MVRITVDLFDDVSMGEVASSGLGRLIMIQELSKHSNWNLNETLVFICDTFGFKHDDTYNDSGLPMCWDKFKAWQDANNLRTDFIKGPHAVTLLKLLAIKHGRNVSTEQ